MLFESIIEFPNKEPFWIILKLTELLIHPIVDKNQCKPNPCKHRGKCQTGSMVILVTVNQDIQAKIVHEVSYIFFLLCR